MCAPWGHDVDDTRCVELRPFVRNDEPAEELNMDAAADASVEVHFFIYASTPVGTDEMETDDDGWPAQLDCKMYSRLPPTLIPLAARRAHLRQAADRLGRQCTKRRCSTSLAARRSKRRSGRLSSTRPLSLRGVR